MELMLWRHAEAEEAVLGQSDLKRHLTKRGKTQARQVADWIRAHRPRALRILASPAERCQQTARALALPYDVEARLGTTAEVSDLLQAAEWSDGTNGSTQAVLLIGHQPTLGRLVAYLLSGEEADWNFKKGALWWFSQRIREGKPQTILRAMICPDML